MFREKNPVAWSYHRHTSRWLFNIHDLNTPTYEVSQVKEHLEADLVQLPDPALPATPLSEAIAGRTSCRRFADDPMSLGDLSDVLFAGYGVTGQVDLGTEFLERPVPSGGGLYPLELYVLAQNVDGLAGGVYHYVPLGHRLEVIHPHRLPPHLTSELFLGQPYLVKAGAVVVITSVVERSLWKYEDRGYRYILLEAGHVAQNLNLCATAASLGSLNLGGFFDEDLTGLLHLEPEEEIVLYGIAIGVATTADRVQGRMPDEDDGVFRAF